MKERSQTYRAHAAACYKDAGDANGAVACYQRAVHCDPASFEAWIQLGA
jgi:hypothetical protein